MGMNVGASEVSGGIGKGRGGEQVLWADRA
jgi:hypothetical protein